MASSILLFKYRRPRYELLFLVNALLSLASTINSGSSPISERGTTNEGSSFNHDYHNPLEHLPNNIQANVPNFIECDDAPLPGPTWPGWPEGLNRDEFPDIRTLCAYTINTRSAGCICDHPEAAHGCFEHLADPLLKHPSTSLIMPFCYWSCRCIWEQRPNFDFYAIGRILGLLGNPAMQVNPASTRPRDPDGYTQQERDRQPWRGRVAGVRQGSMQGVDIGGSGSLRSTCVNMLSQPLRPEQRRVSLTRVRASCAAWSRQVNFQKPFGPGGGGTVG